MAPGVRLYDRLGWHAGGARADALGAHGGARRRLGAPSRDRIPASGASTSGWWDYAKAYLLDRERGSWHSRLDRDNTPHAGTQVGKPDTYHSLQAMLLPRLPLTPSFASALAADQIRRGLACGHDPHARGPASASIGTDLWDIQIPPVEKIIRTVLVYVAIVAIIRVAGKRLMAQMNSLDLVVVLLLNNVVQNAIIGDDNSITRGVIDAIVLVVVNAAAERTAQGLARLPPSSGDVPPSWCAMARSSRAAWTGSASMPPNSRRRCASGAQTASTSGPRHLRSGRLHHCRRQARRAGASSYGEFTAAMARLEERAWIP